MVLRISNQSARALWLHRQGLSSYRSGTLKVDELSQIIGELGFVQLDSIQVTARAHHHILWTRHNGYRQDMYDALLSDNRVFEHFTHDASILPMETYPYWRGQFKRLEERAKSGAIGKHMPPVKDLDQLLARIEQEGPLCSRDFKGGERADKSRHAWARPPHKIGLDMLWYSGELATAYRHNFQKYYDLATRVIPDAVRHKNIDPQEQVDWLCEQALKRLGFASAQDIAKFWDVVPVAQVKDWIERMRGERKIISIEIESYNKEWGGYFAPTNIEQEELEPGKISKTLRILNPFDPAIRDRKRLKTVFGYDYRIEIFTPAKKRQYGYYVCPLLEGTRFVGRIDVQADRKGKTLNINNIWWERGVTLTHARTAKLNASLTKLARFTGVAFEGL